MFALHGVPNEISYSQQYEDVLARNGALPPAKWKPPNSRGLWPKFQMNQSPAVRPKARSLLSFFSQERFKFQQEPRSFSQSSTQYIVVPRHPLFSGCPPKSLKKARVALIEFPEPRRSNGSHSRESKAHTFLFLSVCIFFEGNRTILSCCSYSPRFI
jgi:hypothetical protein